MFVLFDTFGLFFLLTLGNRYFVCLNLLVIFAFFFVYVIVTVIDALTLNVGGQSLPFKHKMGFFFELVVQLTVIY